jgi:hypothetical protein
MPDRRAAGGRPWPWIVLLLATLPAVWYVVDFESDPDGEFPSVARPTFSVFPPAAYRVAEPGDTLDRMGLYAGAAAIVLAAVGWSRSRRTAGHAGLWPSALALALAGSWHAMNPGSLPDGWHGLGWRVVFDPNSPWGLRLALAVAALGLLGVVGANLRRRPASREGLGLLAVAAVLVAARQLDPPGMGPPGYWPRWAFFLGMLAYAMALVRALPPAAPRSRGVRLGVAAARLACWALLVVAGRAVLWYERPIDRLRAVVPGRVYVSAMPGRRGLEIAHSRHRFRTIINLFPEDTPLRSPLLEEEEGFAREHGILYYRNTTFRSDPDELMDATLALARDPERWPVLVHCHAGMDRTPAWMGIYQFVELGRPLDEVMQGIERHRGLRPKASVTLMYARQLPRLAPDRFAADPTASLLMRCAEPALADYVGRSAPATGVGAASGATRR